MKNTNNIAWTEEKDNIIKQYYPTDGVNVTQKLPGRKKNECLEHDQSYDTNIHLTEEK